MKNKEFDNVKFLNVCWKSGLLVQSKVFMKLKTDKERYQRLRTLVNEGYRIILYGGKNIDIINIKGLTISREIEKELREAFNYLKIEKFNPEESFRSMFGDKESR